MSKEKQTLRVAAQLTISPRIISLVAEEDRTPFKKGQVVKRINRGTLDRMERPLNVAVSSGGGTHNHKATARPVLIKRQENGNKQNV